MVRLILLEDDGKVKEYLTALINGSEGFLVEAAFHSTEEAIQYFEMKQNGSIDIILTDIELTGKSGIEFITWFKPRYPEVQIMVLSSYNDSDRIFKALKAGALGYILKNISASRLIESLHELQQGGSPMTGQIARMVVSAFQKDVVINDPQENLSLREKEVLQWLAQGFRYQDIADKLFISLETVRTHIRNIYEKLQTHNRKEALKKAGLS